MITFDDDPSSRFPNCSIAKPRDDYFLCEHIYLYNMTGWNCLWCKTDCGAKIARDMLALK